MENNNMPPIPEEETVVEEVETQEEEYVAVQVEQPVRKMDQKTILTIVAIVLGCLSFILRGLAIYSLVFAFLVLFISVGAVVCAIVSYKKEVFISLIALIVAISACGSSVSLITSFIAEALFAPTYEPEEIDYSQFFGDDYSSFFEDDNNGDSSDYFWD